MLYLFAHNEKNFVKAGDEVEAFKTKIGSIGTAYGKYYAHLHFSISDGLTVQQILNYINGWSKGAVLEYYKDPRGVDFNKMFGRKMDVGKAGYDWLQPIENGSPHPGVDVNGTGGGNSDIGYEFTSPVDGEVLYTQDKKDGWGKLIIIKQKMTTTLNPNWKKAVSSTAPLLNFDYGESLNENESEEFVKKVEKLIEKNEMLEKKYDELDGAYSQMSIELSDRQSDVVKMEKEIKKLREANAIQQETIDLLEDLGDSIFDKTLGGYRLIIKKK